MTNIILQLRTQKDDGDDNEWDELKPDVVARVKHYVGTTCGFKLESPESVKPLASDNYVQKSGTSMSVSSIGFIAASRWMKI